MKRRYPIRKYIDIAGKVRIFLFLLFFCFASVRAGGFPVVVNGKAAAGLFPDPFEAAELEALKILEKYLYLSTGNVPEITEKGPRIVFKVEKGKMDIEGFRFSFPSKEVMVISGGSPLGLKYGALEFCERFLGIRFLFPGKNGTHIPKVENLVIPRKEFQDAPKFLTRSLFSFPHWTSKSYRDWFPLLKSSDPYRIKIGHNLYRMFAPSKYAAEHPEYYPVINGKRYIPKAPKLGVHWQPCMTEPGVIAESARMICEAFAEDPSLRAWSLAQTDGDGFCECKNCKKFYPVPDVPHRFGSKDRSRLYLDYCNKVAEKVAEKYPDAKLTFYAYNHASLAPAGVRLHPALIPVITYDRANHLDPERKRMDLERQKQWQEIAGEICWYDYMKSNGYVLPRILIHHIASRLREGYSSGVRHLYAEYYPFDFNEQIWCEGPQAYVTFKLLWDPFQDENKILDDWYRSAVGEKAAPYLRNYFEDIEKFWAEKVPHSDWFKRCARTYQIWTWHDYTEVLEADFFDCAEKNLRKCLELAPAGPCRERAQYFLYGFLDRRYKIEYFLKNRKMRQVPAAAFTQKVFEDNFDKNINSWKAVCREKGTSPIVSFAAKKGTSGSGALVLMPRNGAESTAEKYFTVTKKGDFMLTADFLCEGLQETAIPYVSAEWCDQKGTVLHPVYYCDTHGKDGKKWQKIVLKFTSPGKLPARLKIRLSLCRTQKGRVLFDNAVIRSTAENILKPEKKN